MPPQATFRQRVSDLAERAISLLDEKEETTAAPETTEAPASAPEQSAAPVESPETPAVQATTRRNVLIALAGGSALAAVGGAVYLGNEALEVAKGIVPTAIDKASNREFEERKLILIDAFMNLQESANKLLATIIDFLLSLKDEVLSSDGAANLLSTLWNGMWRDGEELIYEGDMSPDQIFQSGLQFVATNPVLSKKWQAIDEAYQALETSQDELLSIEDRLMEFNDQDLDQLMDDMKVEFMEKMKERFPVLGN
jgi:hypothetical protein